MLASMRYFLRFIELEETFDNHGFEKKVCIDDSLASSSGVSEGEHITDQ